MVSIDEALEKIYTTVTQKGHEIIPIEASLNRIVAEAYYASFDLPRFDNSAMDGYAVKVEDANRIVTIKEITYAGDTAQEAFESGEVVKIMTGAPIPIGCEAIVPIENVTSTPQGIRLPEKIQKNMMIRYRGEDIKKGTIFLRPNEKITAYTLARLASQGVSHIKVYRQPKVVIFSTGEELKAHYEQIQPHQLYNSNAPMFYARAQELGADVSYLNISGDSLEALQEAIKQAMDADLILTSGGVSVGDKDFTIEAFKNAGMEVLFSKVNIKPGKPTTFGKLGRGFVINLPGNPLAAMVNFEMFVKPTLLKLSGSKSFYHATITTQVQKDHPIKVGKYSVILGRWDGSYFKPIENQKPGMVSPLDQADGMVVTYPTTEKLSRDNNIKMIPIKLAFWSEKREDFYN